MTRLAAALHGEVAASTVEAYRRPDASACQDMMDAEQLPGSPVTAEQAAVFLGEVERWTGRARRAVSDASYDVAAEIVVPAPLAAWVKAEPCPRAHLTAMLAAARRCGAGPRRRWLT